MIDKTEFSAKNLTANAGILPLLNYTSEQGIFQELEDNLIFDSKRTEAIKMNHLKTLICGGFVGADRLERFLLLKNDPLINKCGINVREPENISRFLGKFDFKTTHMMRSINFNVFKKLLKKKKLREITVDIDSRAVNVEGKQEGAVNGYNPGYPGNNCYNILMAFCDELKAYITGFMRSGNTYTANGAAEMIKEIIANLGDEAENITFRMDSGYFSEEIADIIENGGYHYVVKGKNYPNMIENAYDRPVKIWENYGDEKQVMFCCMKPEKWIKVRKFAVVRELKPANERRQISLFVHDRYTHDFYVTNTTWSSTETVKFYEKRGNCENYIKEAKYNMNIGSLKMDSFWANEAYFQVMMLVYNIFLLFKIDRVSINEYRQWIQTFRLKYVFVAAKIVRTGRQTIMKLMKDYLYKDIFQYSRV